MKDMVGYFMANIHSVAKFISMSAAERVQCLNSLSGAEKRFIFHFYQNLERQVGWQEKVKEKVQ